MRLFAALQPPQESRDEIVRALGACRDSWPGLRWLPSENWHVTLAFYGEVPQDILPELSVRLARAAARYAPMTIAFTGAGAFPSARRCRVVWTGLDGPLAELSKLAASLAAGARRAGVPQRDERRFRPHLSLARSRSDIDVRPLIETLASFRGTPWLAPEVHLVRSHLGAAVRYEPIATWPLARALRDDDYAPGVDRPRRWLLPTVLAGLVFIVVLGALLT